MKQALAIGVLCALALGGCQRNIQGETHDGGRGRYVGIGHYAPGGAWSRVLGAGQPKDSAAAHLADDDQIIVIMDSETGEVRQCGNLSGVCVTMNPWSRPATAAAPVQLAKRADQLQQNAEPSQSGAAAAR